MAEVAPALRHQHLLLPEHGMPARELQLKIDELDPDTVLTFEFEALDIMVFSSIGVIVNRKDRTVTGPQNRTVEPSFTEFELIDYFASHPDRIVTREQLFSHIWGDDIEPNPNLVRVHFWNAKDKLNKKADVPKSVFHTIHSVGYLFRTKTAVDSTRHTRNIGVHSMIG